MAEDGVSRPEPEKVNAFPRPHRHTAKLCLPAAQTAIHGAVGHTLANQSDQLKIELVGLGGGKR